MVFVKEKDMTKVFIKEFIQMVVMLMVVTGLIFGGLCIIKDLHEENAAYASEIKELKAENKKLKKEIDEHVCERIFKESPINIKTTATQEKITINNDISVSREDVELIALCTMGEAEGESEYGQRLVIDTILNRLDDERFPDTISEVIYQPNQFECMWNGRIERCEVTEEMCRLVREELQNRTNNDVMLFQMYNYSQWGTPLFKEGCHYFSDY